eukprot:366212-Chlamydomonas_euryale.AAC.29
MSTPHSGPPQTGGGESMTFTITTAGKMPRCWAGVACVAGAPCGCSSRRQITFSVYCTGTKSDVGSWFSIRMRSGRRCAGKFSSKQPASTHPHNGSAPRPALIMTLSLPG